MKVWQSHLLPLILWVQLKVDVVTAGCTISKYDEADRCECTADSLRNPIQMQQCLDMHEVEVKDGLVQVQDDHLLLLDHPLIRGLDLLPLKRLLLTRVQIPGLLLKWILIMLPKTNIRRLDLTGATLEAPQALPKPTMPFKVTTLRMENVTFDPSFLQPSLRPLNIWLLSSLTHLTLRRVSGWLSLDNGDCVSTVMMVNVTELDLSDNGLTDDSLVNLSRCLSSSTPPVSSLRLSILLLSQNQLHFPECLCPLLQVSPNLVELDLSHNTLNDSAVGSSCFSSAMELKRLNLSYTGIQAADNLVPVGVEVLDLNGNLLQEFRNPPHRLRELYLSNNHLRLLPDLNNATQLQVLTLDRNQLTNLPGEGTLGLVLGRLSVLRAGENPFACACDIIETVGLLRKNHHKVKDWPDAFLCTQNTNNSALIRLEDLSLSNCIPSVNKASSDMSMNVDVALCIAVVVAVTVILG